MKKAILFLLGWIAFILGVAGIFLPLLPSTPFLLLSSWCFLHSSERAYHWLRRQKLIGDIIQDWETNKAISQKNKIIALLMIAVSAAFISFRKMFLPGKILILLILACVSLFILTRKTREKRRD